MVGRIDKGDTLVEKITDGLNELRQLNPNDEMLNLIEINTSGIQRNDEFKKVYGYPLKSKDIDECLKRFSSDLYKRVEDYRESIAIREETRFALQHEEDYQDNEMPFTD